MKRPLRQPRLHAQGVAAVEFAILLPVILLLLAAPLFLGWIFWHYSVAEKAAQDAARILAKATAAEIRTPGAGGTEAPIAAAARAVVMAEIAELNPGPYAPGVEVMCDGGVCFGFQIPTNVTVRVTLPLYDEFLGAFTSSVTGGDQILVKAVATTTYVGN